MCGRAVRHATMMRVTIVRPAGQVPPRQVPPGQVPPIQVPGRDVPGEQALVELASQLGAASVAGWSAAERDLVARAAGCAPGSVRAAAARDRIRAGGDPLGDAFCALRGPSGRRALGQTFTPPPVIESMIDWAAGTGIRPARVVDPGSGSARMLLAAGRRWPQASLVGVEIDPLAAIVGRASLAAAGLASRSSVLLGDYRDASFPPAGGPTLFLGNPPYVRHHQIAATGKEWLRRAAREQGVPASGLSGLHAHFFLATAGHAVPGDLGVLITAAEWLDVNYGRLVRELLLGALGGQAVHLVEPAVPVFADAAATSVITCFRPGTVPEAIAMRRVSGPADLGALAGGTPVPTAVLRAASRWGPLLRPAAPGAQAAGPQPAGPQPAGPQPAGREDHQPAGRQGHGPAASRPGSSTGRPWPAGQEASRRATSSWVSCAGSTGARSRARTRCG